MMGFCCNSKLWMRLFYSKSQIGLLQSQIVYYTISYILSACQFFLFISYYLISCIKIFIVGFRDQYHFLSYLIIFEVENIAIKFTYITFPLQYKNICTPGVNFTHFVISNQNYLYSALEASFIYFLISHIKIFLFGAKGRSHFLSYLVVFEVENIIVYQSNLYI